MNNRVKETTDYTIFERSSQNRNLSIPQVNRLRRSMHQNGFLLSFPISCIEDGNGVLLVTDGQHRLEAAKALGIPVYYVIEEKSVDPSVIPTQKKWTAADFLNRYAAAGNETYLYIKQVAQHFGVSSTTAAALLLNDLNNNRTNEFRSGNAEIRTKEEALSALSCAKNCLRVNPNLLINPLVKTIFRIHVLRNVDFHKALMRIEQNTDQMVRFNSMDRGYEEIEKAYNFRLPHNQRIPLGMLIKQQLILRKRTFGKEN